MKNITLGISIAALAAIASFFINASSASAPSMGFAVVELFTSEGCSSCPPADALVAKVQKQYNGKPVYILAYHVDYWNRLGWKDVFSNSAYSQRQRNYANYLKLSSVYTPQIVVNGKTDFVGSEAGNLHNAIEQGLQNTAQSAVALSSVSINGDNVTVNYTTDTKPGAVLALALVEKYAQTAVKAGENNGRNLAHVQIVRALHQINVKAGKSGADSFKIPNGVKAENTEIIGFLQNTSSGEISGATKIAVL